MAVVVTYDTAAVREMLERLPRELRDKAATQALNKTADKTKTEMKRKITAVYNLKSTEVAGSLKVVGASAARNLLSATLYPTTLSGSRKGRAMNVVHFLEGKTTLAEAKRRANAGTLEDLFFRFRKLGGKKTIAAAGGKSKPFLGNKGRTVFRRTGVGREIEPVQVIDVPQMFNAAQLNQAVLEKSQADLLVETDRSVKLMLSRM